MQETIQEMLVWSLGQEDDLEKELTTHSGIPVQEIPWTQEPGGLQSLGSQISGYTTSTAGMKTDK